MLRHFFVTALIQSGVDMKTAQTLAGHHSAAFTLDQYAVAVPQQLEDAGELRAHPFGVALKGDHFGRRRPSCRTRLVVCREFELTRPTPWRDRRFSCKKTVARPDGFEPPTTWFEARCSIQLSYGRPRAV
jgi:hypothetical protein